MKTDVMNKKDEFLVKDIFLSAFLLSNNLRLIELRKDTNFFWFVFQNKTKAEDLANKFWQQETVVNVATFVNSFRNLKSMIFSRKD